MPSGHAQRSSTLEAKEISPSGGSEEEEELGCRNGHVTRHKEEFHLFMRKTMFDTGMQGKMECVVNKKGEAR